VRKRFDTPGGPVDALGPVDLTVGVGEFVALVGPSGSGQRLLAARPAFHWHETARGTPCPYRSPAGQAISLG